MTQKAPDSPSSPPRARSGGRAARAESSRSGDAADAFGAVPAFSAAGVTAGVADGEGDTHGPLSSLLARVRRATQPIRDFAAVPRALQGGVNLPYFIEGLVYFGILTVMTKFLSENVGLGDIFAGRLVAAFTGGITGAMFLLGELSDRWGVRRSLLFALLFMLAGRTLISLGETLHLAPGAFGPLCNMTIAGVALVVIGYGAYQPAAYAAVKEYTSEKTAAMGYAMLYAVQNFGSFGSGLLSPIVRERSQAALPPNGITGVFWVYVGFTALGLVLTYVLLPRKRDAESVSAAVAKSLGAVRKTVGASASGERSQDGPAAASAASPKVLSRAWLREHPLSDAKFSFFIFILIPVQTLFAHNWLTLPLYIERAFGSVPQPSYQWVSHRFEFFANLNPLLIFVLTPLVAALTARVSVYRMMIVGTAVMALPTFLLALGPSPALLILFTLLMSIGEALWQPRFLQYVAEIAPPGKTGMYMGVAQFPWFLTKLLTGTYSGWFLVRYCPAPGPGGVPAPMNTEFMWFVYALIACISPVGLLLASGWVGKSISARVGAEKPAA